jgi:hypothetical protein
MPIKFLLAPAPPLCARAARPSAPAARRKGPKLYCYCVCDASKRPKKAKSKTEDREES